MIVQCNISALYQLSDKAGVVVSVPIVNKAHENTETANVLDIKSNPG